MALSFVNPWLLSFLALGALPVLIHLFARRRPRRVPVSSLYYIRPVVKQTQRLRRPRDIIILILRTLLVLALVIIFSRPIWHPKQSLARSSQANRVALLIDRSLSMQCNEGGLTRFGSAQAAALQVLEMLPAGAQANIVWMASGYETTADKLTDNIELLRRDIENKPVSYEMASVQPALDKAVELVSSREGGQVYVISDFQTTNWKNADFGRLPPNVQVLNIVVGRRQTPNHSIGKVEISPASPVAGETFRVACTVANMGPDPVEQEVLLEVGTVIRQEKITLAPYSRGNVSFDCTMKKRGRFPLKVSVSEDNLSADNTCYGAVTISPSIRVGVCGMAKDAGLRLLKNAIATNAREAGTVRLIELPMQALETADRMSLDVIFLYGWDGRGHTQVAGAITASKATFVWVLPSGPGGARGIDSSLFAKCGVDFAVGAWRRADPGKPLSMAVADPKHPLVGVFDGGRSGDVGLSDFRGAFRVTGDGGHTILAYGDDAPALVSVDLLKRTFFLWNIALGPDTSNFANSNTFLPIVQELVLQNRIQKGHPTFVTGDSISLPLPVDTNAASLGLELSQGGKPRRLPQRRVIVLPQKGQLRLFLDKAEEPGQYRFSDRSGSIHLVAANVPVVESDLRCLEKEKLERRGSSSALMLGKESIRSIHKGISLWPYFLACGIVAFLAESILLAVWKVKE